MKDKKYRSSLEFAFFDRGYEYQIEQGDFSEFQSMN